MKYETFSALIDIAVDIFKVSYERDRRLTAAFGGDTNIVMDDCNKMMNRITATLSIELNDFGDDSRVGNMIDYLVYENLIMDNYDPKELKITINDKEYPVTTKVIWDILQNKI